MKLNINDTFNKELPADKNLSNNRRTVTEACYSYVTPRSFSNPSLVHVSEGLLEQLGLTKEDVDSKEFLDMVSGSKVLEDTHPYAMCYGGHQFGHWAGQLGDGRAINLFEILHNEKRWALQLKGSGETPYSRSADGLAVLRSSIREHLCSEAMYHLGVPTTRSLSLCLTGDKVLRDVMYDGNADYEPGAIVCRVAPSFIRFGNFQILAVRQDINNLRKLTDYTIRHFYPEIKVQGKEAYLKFFQLVSNRTLEMVIHWQRVGFVHGVMNTDNMSILGLSIDYGPYGWQDNYDQAWTPNTTDRQFKRYQFGDQAKIAQWNLLQLANSLYPLILEVESLQVILNGYYSDYQEQYLAMMTQKVGLYQVEDGDKSLIMELERCLQLIETDMTIFFRNLTDVNAQTSVESEGISFLKEALYDTDLFSGEVKASWISWLETYVSRLSRETLSNKDRIKAMNKTNPKYVLRNYMAQMAIEKAEKGDYSLISELHDMLKNPYLDQEEYDQWFAKRPDWARDKIGCSMLSCSS